MLHSGDAGKEQRRGRWRRCVGREHRLSWVLPGIDGVSRLAGLCGGNSLGRSVKEARRCFGHGLGFSIIELQLTMFAGLIELEKW
ncbi:hypothetical protein M0R45_019803 [Rubus argutus]|uniref:Uncharacterized protein n=1 Tax=Rubus argutus TaxID=59490 RepID=A0AAW1X8K1_RUBAR